MSVRSFFARSRAISGAKRLRVRVNNPLAFLLGNMVQGSWGVLWQWRLYAVAVVRQTMAQTSISIECDYLSIERPCSGTIWNLIEVNEHGTWRETGGTAAFLWQLSEERKNGKKGGRLGYGRHV